MNNAMRKKILVILLILSGVDALSQQNYTAPSYIPSVPTATEMFKYINYPVNHGTGLVDISIPLYEIKIGDITLPITLKYHSSGIKVLESPSCVGAGWILEAEPVVSRMIMDGPDEMQYLRNSLVDMNTLNALQLDAWSKGNGFYDRTPDKFYYRLPDKSGGFYYVKKNQGSSQDTAIIHPYEPIRITEDIQLRQLNGFKITDEKGILYNFDNIHESTYTAGSGQRYRSAWKCTSITSPIRGQALINFSYQSCPNYAANYCNDSEQVEVVDFIGYLNETNISSGSHLWALVYYGIVSNLGSEGCYYYSNVNGVLTRHSMVNCSHPTGGYSIEEKKVSQISFGAGNSVRFTYANGKSPLMTKMEVYAGGERIRIIEFEYSPLGASDGLFILDRIVISRSDKSVPEKYEFGYHQPSSFPHYSLRSFDLWGYCNMVKNVYTSVPYQVFRTSSSIPALDGKEITLGGYRGASSTAAQTGILTSITYPTGGKKTFSYELNRFKSPDGHYEEGGGVRIKEIADYNHKLDVTPQIVRKYKYGQNEDGLGYCFDYPSLDRFRTFNTNMYNLANNSYNSHGIHMISTSCQLFNSPMGNSNRYPGNAPVVYGMVSEYIGDGIKSSFEYDYGDYMPNSFDIFPYPPFYYDYRDEWTVGRQKRVTLYKKENASYVPVTGKVYRYSQYMTRTDPSYYIYRSINRPMLSTLDFRILSSHIRSGCRRLAQEIDTVYDGSNKLVSSKTYTYDVSKKHMFPSKITTVQSDGTVIEKEYKYPKDVNRSGEAETARLKLLESGATGILLEENMKRGNSYTSSTVYDYKTFVNNYGFPYLWKINVGQSPQTRELRTQFMEYSTQGLPLYLTTDNISTAYLWSYNHEYPIAEIKNATFTEVEAAAKTLFAVVDTDALSALSVPNEAKLKDGSLQRALPNALVTTYTYKPLVGMLTSTDPSGITTYYEYDSFSRLKRTYIKEGTTEKTVQTYDYHYQNQ
jgi:YD repeat-containing protein